MFVSAHICVCLSISNTALIDGTGTGQWRKLSVNLPSYIRTSMRLREVHQFERDAVSQVIDMALLD